MRKHTVAGFAYLLLATLLASCASPTPTIVPETQPGDQLLSEYMHGDWCTNREATAQTNKDAGFSALVNVSAVFWRFDQEGDWDVSNSGFLYESYGSWALDGRDTLVLTKDDMAPRNYQAQFKTGGADLVLKDDKEQFLVLSLCD